MFDEIRNKMEAVIVILMDKIAAGHGLQVGYSGGKDSTCVAILMLEAVRRSCLAGVQQARHYIATSNTTIENPSISNHLHIALEEFRAFCEENDLDVGVHIAEPSLAAQFVVSTVGRGTLLRTPENGVRDGKVIRACADDWKVKPLGRLRALLEKEAVAAGFRETIVLLGTRYDESAARSSLMSLRGEIALDAVRHKDGYLTLSSICDWSLSDVWDMLAMFSDERFAPFPSPLSVRSIGRMIDLYRAGNEGTCGVTVGDSGNKAACGSRFGCSICGVSGERDKSMESMIQEPQHAHLAGINRVRNYLLATQWDLSKRELVGRTVSEAGYTRVQADVYSYSHRVALLRYLLTLDATEIERADRHQADLATGKLEDTPVNRELCDIQFQLVTPQQLVAIDFFLSMHHYAPQAFPAVAIWHDVHTLGRRYEVPVVATYPKIPIPLHGWYRVGQYDAEAPVDGLRDYGAEQWNRYRHGKRVSNYAATTAGERVVYFEEADQLEVDAEAACAFVTCTFDTRLMLETQSEPAISSARFWLNEGILRLPSGMAQRYQEMAKRGQYFTRLAERLNLTPTELDEHLIRNAIGDAEHKMLLSRDDQQRDLFQEAA
ncbi:hypothetical protein PQH03_28670 [Ralstonia insidiosa]|jgi:DNA sulfur modification protein DndC|uniref:Phosphoadenosine phosphosulphate reductase domain-containing protein n=1 Tax=Ralstonia insidiosa TaxID=190721 RepID=A0A192A859_9RALS|nr:MULTISPECIES: hypothetical protein [Ralstonia]KMW47595.1 hypothetical protein AC240_08595 [Ralstonia sp. MD27]ANJ76482.1 hypothetical protein A9Y76_28240 [Ralstonia insidiosa]MBA9869659.1 hypothetical protein [Ralstonia insidiosa]MBA9884420.1 hypothetical protein [Ralstonia pickettii]MBA9894092.1 hypothetical protein [Ralstonia pickettii]